EWRRESGFEINAVTGEGEDFWNVIGRNIGHPSPNAVDLGQVHGPLDVFTAFRLVGVGDRGDIAEIRTREWIFDIAKGKLAQLEHTHRRLGGNGGIPVCEGRARNLVSRLWQHQVVNEIEVALAFGTADFGKGAIDLATGIRLGGCARLKRWRQ